MYVREVGSENMNCTELTQDRAQRRTLVLTVMNLWVLLSRILFRDRLKQHTTLFQRICNFYKGGRYPSHLNAIKTKPNPTVIWP